MGGGGFFIPDHLLEIWRSDIGKRSDNYYSKWKESVSHLSNSNQEIINGLIGLTTKAHLAKISSIVLKQKESVIKSYAENATRTFSGEFIESIEDIIPLCGGSADLSGSNCSKSPNMIGIQANNYHGNYIHYGIREHAMGAIMNGIAVYGNMYVYCSTFLAFVDYMRPAIRMASLMELPVIYLMTHDSIGVGEDGPTHQPIEQIASLRSMPNLNVFRPADATETIECWQLALQAEKTPSVICLTRQKVKQVRFEYNKENLSQRGGYILSNSKSIPEIVILSTGSEVSLALEVKTVLEKHTIDVRVVSVPSFDLLAKQSQEYIDKIIPQSSKKVVIEAATRFGWERFAGSDGMFFCIDTFGKSAPAKDLFDYFSLNVDTISKKILNNIRG